MLYLLSIITILLIACLWVIYMYIIKRPERYKQHPKADEKNNYHRDYCNLLNMIPKAKSTGELKMARRRVSDFRKQYKDSISNVCIKNDVQELNQHIEQVKIVLDMHPSTQLN